MTGDDAELEERADALRRVVYGTPDGYETDAATELEHVETELARRAEERRAEASRSDSTTAARRSGAVPAGATGAATVTNSGASGDSPSGGRESAASRTESPELRTGTAEPGATGAATGVATGAEPGAALLRRRQAALAIAGVLGVFGVVAATAVVSLLAPPRGLAVFDRPQQPEDESLVVALGAQADTVRKLDELFGRGFWVYLNGADQVCLSVIPSGGTNLVERGECVSRERFAEHGIAVQYAATELGIHRPRGSGRRDVIVISWRPDAEGVDWELVMIDPPTGDRQTYEEWSSGHDAGG